VRDRLLEPTHASGVPSWARQVPPGRVLSRDGGCRRTELARRPSRSFRLGGLGFAFGDRGFALRFRAVGVGLVEHLIRQALVA